MMLWLARIGPVLVVVATALIWGNLEAAGVALFFVAFARVRVPVRPTRLNIALLSVWLSAFLLAGVVTAVAAGPQTQTRRKLVLGIYDLNCSAPFGTYHYPRDVTELAEGGFHLYYGRWSRVLVCDPRIK